MPAGQSAGDPSADGTAGDWRRAAACRTADPDLFFPVSSSGRSLLQIAQAQAVCAACMVRRPCLEFALATGQAHGVWGGTTEEERRCTLHRPSRPAEAKASGDGS
jgi:WhiB family redox-sensing transcriptional regulator